MSNEALKCSKCGSQAKEGQNFCGQCGKDLRLLGSLVVSRTGLITEMDSNAGKILQIDDGAILGKPFSVFVDVTSRAFFFLLEYGPELF